MSRYTDLVPKPAAASVNTGVSSLRQATMMQIFGPPRDHPSEEDLPVTNPKLKPMIVTESVGLFKVTGHKVAVASLRDVLAQVKEKKPDLYDEVSSAGMLVCRLVRGSKTDWSNHAFGFAIDLKISGVLDPWKDDKTQVGLLELYPFFHAAGWFWGTEFKREDSMHFECGDELVRRWHAEGKLVA